MNRSSILKAILILSPICAGISAKADYTPDFSTGEFPKGITVANETGMVPGADFYKHGWTDKGWKLERVGNRGYVAVAPSHREDGVNAETRSVLTLPAQEITAGTWLRWDARSLVPDMPESYRVEIAEDGSADFTTLLTIDSESADWNTRMLPLADYAGKKCVLRFVCTSDNKYILMLDEIAVTVPAEPIWRGIDTTPRFTDMTNACVTGAMCNIGAPAECASIVCRDADNRIIGRLKLDRIVATNDTVKFAFQAPAILDTRTEYTVSVEPKEGDPVAVEGLSGCYYSSSYVRTHLVDKGTGTWCVNCPQGVIDLENLRKAFRGNLITVDTHITDPMANDSYFADLGYRSIPAFRMDRNSSENYKFDDMERFYDVPTRWRIAVSACAVEGEGENQSVKLTAEFRSAESVDNASGRYRIGYLLMANIQNDSFTQSNSLSTPQAERFYFLPSRIPGSMYTYRDVSLTYDGAFDGLEGSVPATMEAEKDFYHVWNVSRPELLTSLRDAEAVVYVLDTETGLILNAASARLTEDFDVSGVRGVIAGADSATLRHCGEGLFSVTLPAPGAFVLKAYDAAGQLRTTATGNADAPQMMKMDLPKGIYIVVLESAQGSARAKIIL